MVFYFDLAQTLPVSRMLFRDNFGRSRPRSSDFGRYYKNRLIAEKNTEKRLKAILHKA
jgi:hypothetical protein